jgi:hypothetical protein
MSSATTTSNSLAAGSGHIDGFSSCISALFGDVDPPGANKNTNKLLREENWPDAAHKA